MNNNIPIRLLVTAGATSEPIDEVRYLSNKSSGCLGCLIALQGAIGQHEVTLLHARSSLSPSNHPRLRSIMFSSTRDLSAKLQEHWPSHDVLIMAAAVADFTQRGGQSEGKIRRGDSQTIELAPTDDLVASIARESRSDQRIVAFALDVVDQLETTALQKLQSKKVDAIIANPLETMESSQITATIYCRDGRTIKPPKSMHKADFAVWLIKSLEEITPSI
jgi:phosphopantothenoylcysteine decarboxylase/phosphopantothenate--cysteine ligase